jgi:hypothetical protein
MLRSAHWLQAIQDRIVLAIVCTTVLAGMLGDAWTMAVVGAVLLSLDGWPRYRTLLRQAERADREWLEQEEIAQQFVLRSRQPYRIPAAWLISAYVVVSLGKSLFLCSLALMLGRVLRRQCACDQR